MVGNGPELQPVYVKESTMNDSVSVKTERSPNHQAWKEIVAQYQKSEVWPGVWQLVNTLVPYAALWYLMHLSLRVSSWLTLPLAVLAAGFLVRTFIIFHDCTHGSFFPSGRRMTSWVSSPAC